MKYTAVLSALALVSSAYAVPHQPYDNQQGSVPGHSMVSATGKSQMGQCLSSQEAQQWLQKFLGVFSKTDPNRMQTANQIIADNFAVYSNSIRSLQGQPLNGQPAIGSKQEWISNGANAPTIRGIETRDVIVGCDKIVWHWSFQGVGAALYQTNGFNLFHMVRRGKQLQSNRFDIEFDSIAWGLNTGLGVTYRNGTQARGSGSGGRQSQGGRLEE
ncbi:hypothetical protein HII31_04740 [Pseudocercospora fuligena]|uniref:NTF2-like domain-containing protein n=1 Tax=Pseudocercospora fuligena TaxID=685502 RepID=A0A8H6VP65_9PEZI|nr:hypothetical protein HII31_04740 [Pseudocercospora fuligena]